MEQKLISFTKPQAKGVTDFSADLVAFTNDGFTIKQFSADLRIATNPLDYSYYIVTVLLERPAPRGTRQAEVY